MSCTKRNPFPPCSDGFIEKLSKKGVTCCYKDSKTKKNTRDKKTTKDTKKKDNKKQTTCTKRNPDPPCNNGFIIKKNKKGDECCYKGVQKEKKSKSNSNKKNNKVDKPNTKKKEKEFINENFWEKQEDLGICRLEFKDSKSNKFWQYKIKDNKALVNYGKIGSNGQEQQLTFKDVKEALTEMSKLEQSKIKKGYKSIVNTIQMYAHKIDKVDNKKNNKNIPKKSLSCEIKQEKKHFVVSGEDTKEIKDELKKIGKWIPKFKGWSFRNDDKEKVINLLTDKFFKINIVEENQKILKEKNDNRKIPKFYNLLEYKYKYNIPEIFKTMYEDSEVDGTGEYGLEGYQQSFLTKEMLDLNYYQEVRKFIKKNNLNIGDILFIGRKSGDLYSSPGDGFAIVTEIDNFETGEKPFYGIDIVFNHNILNILQKNRITYKECFENFKENYPDDWENFTEDSSSGDDSSFYKEEGLWDQPNNDLNDSNSNNNTPLLKAVKADDTNAVMKILDGLPDKYNKSNSNKKDSPKKKVKKDSKKKDSPKKTVKKGKEVVNLDFWGDLDNLDWDRYTFSDGNKSNKFWEYTTYDDYPSKILLVRYGKIGNKGTLVQTTYDTKEEADVEIKKLVKSKEKKGYKY